MYALYSISYTNNICIIVLNNMVFSTIKFKRITCKYDSTNIIAAVQQYNVPITILVV